MEDIAYEIIITAGRIQHSLTCFRDFDEALDFVEGNDGVWVDENEFEWDMSIEETNADNYSSFADDEFKELWEFTEEELEELWDDEVDYIEGYTTI